MIELISALSFVLISYTSLSATCLSATWIDRKAEGWAWYEDTPLPKRAEEGANERKTTSASQKVAEVRRQLEEKLAQAIIKPTPETMRAYMIEQKKWVDQSARFSEVWAKVLLSHPEYDQAASTPVSQYGIQTYNHVMSERKDDLIKKIAKDHGLFFFYKGRCKFSVAFAHVVQAFAQKYTWQVFAISLDGVPIKEFATRKRDNGIAREFSVKAVPALFIVNPKSHVITPIAYGPLSLDQLENNVMLQFQNSGERYEE